MTERQTNRGFRTRFQSTLRLEDSLSLAAFLMSLSITLINVYYAMRGAEIAVDPPAQIILYRDGVGESSVLTAAVRFDMINVADGYGDVLKTAELSLQHGRVRFDYEGTLRTVFAAVGQQAAPCELGLRCLQLAGLYIIERSDEILDMPSGTARAYNLAFPLVSSNCAGSALSECKRFSSFDKAVQQIPAGGLSLILRLGFHSDGDRRFVCSTPAIDRDYLEKVGWVSVPCAA